MAAGIGQKTAGSMTQTVLLIVHTKSSDPGEAEVALNRAGYATRRLCPKQGDVLPESHESYRASIVFGGPQSLTHDELRPYLKIEMAWMESSLAAGKPFFGICLGAQMLAMIHGARVERHAEGKKQIGYYPIHPTAEGRSLFKEGLHVYHWHGEGFELPRDAELLAAGSTFPNEAFRLGRSAYGVQFHPEVNEAIMRRWVGAGVEDGDILHDGAQSGETQEALRRLHEAGMHRWLEGFVRAWLGDGEAVRGEAGG